MDKLQPSIYGDIETLFGFKASLFCLLIENVKFAATFGEVARKPDSVAWIFGLALSVVAEVLKR